MTSGSRSVAACPTADGAGARDEARAAISRHPAFPAIVATWFATLLGVGSMVLPAVLLERAVESTGIATLIPAAAAPLSLTARGLIALVSAVTGAFAGHAIARRVSGAHGGATSDSGLAPRTRRPISVTEDLGDDILVDGMGLLVTKNHVRHTVDVDGSSDRRDMAPLPGDRDDDHEPAFDERTIVRALEWPAVPPNPQAPGARHDLLEPLPFSAPSLSRRARGDCQPKPAPVERGAPGGNLAELVQRLEDSIERRRETMTSTIPAQNAQGPAKWRGSQADTDTALREALATLRRMSGAL